MKMQLSEGVMGMMTLDVRLSGVFAGSCTTKHIAGEISDYGIGL